VIDERLHALGSWDVSLIEATPPSILQRLTLDETDNQNLGMATLVVTDARIDPVSLGSGDTGTAYHPLFDAAIYCGVLWDIKERRRRLSGYGLSAWLGTPDDTGELWVGNAMTSSSNNARIFEEDSDDVFDWMVNGGTKTAIDGSGATVTLRSTSLYGSTSVSTPVVDVPLFPEPLTRREVLNRVCTYTGWRYHITPQMVVRSGTPAGLFPTVRCVVGTDIGTDPDLLTIRGEVVDWDESLDGYSNKRVSFDDNGGTYPPVTWAYPNSTPPTPDYYGPDGQGAHVVLRDDHQQDENILQWGARMLTIAPGAAFPSRLITLSGFPSSDSVRLIPGESIWVYDPTVGLEDTSNEVRVGGEILHPAEVDLYGIVWPVVQDMGVYVVYYDQSTTDLDVIDLTPYVAYEDGPTTLDVGAPHRVL
jgi:hypothetical protein